MIRKGRTWAVGDELSHAITQEGKVLWGDHVGRGLNLKGVDILKELLNGARQ